MSNHGIIWPKSRPSSPGNHQPESGEALARAPWAEPEFALLTNKETQDLDHLFSVTYEYLRKLASSVKSGDSSQTLNPTALVNEAYLKLADSHGKTPESLLHFKRMAAQAMRKILVDAARKRMAAKRGGDKPLVSFDEDLYENPNRSPSSAEDLLATHAALEKLEALDPQQAHIVECHFFGGFSIQETAEILGISSATVDRHWRSARAWLALRLRRKQ